MTVDDFTKEPVSITELRGARKGGSEDWTARDALVRLLRQIDGGELNVSGCIVFYNAEGRPGWIAGGAEAFETIGFAALGLDAYIASCRHEEV